jgi:hypothetical protein
VKAEIIGGNKGANKKQNITASTSCNGEPVSVTEGVHVRFESTGALSMAST